jgi:nucleotide-binding universal stress UspA family protein
MMKFPLKTILAAVDFSEPSQQALDAAVSMAAAFDATLHVVHVFELPIPAVSPYEVAIPEAYLEESREAASKRLADAAAHAGSKGARVETHLGEGPAARSICRTAEEIGADLIVMGTHGHTGIKHLVLGSVAERTLRHAPCAVLAVKARAEG